MLLHRPNLHTPVYVSHIHTHRMSVLLFLIWQQAWLLFYCCNNSSGRSTYATEMMAQLSAGWVALHGRTGRIIWNEHFEKWSRHQCHTVRSRSYSRSLFAAWDYWGMVNGIITRAPWWLYQPAGSVYIKWNRPPNAGWLSARVAGREHR